jgi:hypothetical protein
VVWGVLTTVPETDTLLSSLYFGKHVYQHIISIQSPTEKDGTYNKEWPRVRYIFPQFTHTHTHTLWQSILQQFLGNTLMPPHMCLLLGHFLRSWGREMITLRWWHRPSTVPGKWCAQDKHISCECEEGQEGSEAYKWNILGLGKIRSLKYPFRIKILITPIVFIFLFLKVIKQLDFIMIFKGSS